MNIDGNVCWLTKLFVLLSYLAIFSVKHFVNEAEINDCFNADSPGYKHLGTKVNDELITVQENIEEEEDDNMSHVEVEF